jgi:hypothetical protein
MMANGRRCAPPRGGNHLDRRCPGIARACAEARPEPHIEPSLKPPLLPMSRSCSCCSLPDRVEGQHVGVEPPASFFDFGPAWRAPIGAGRPAGRLGVAAAGRSPPLRPRRGPEPPAPPEPSRRPGGRTSGPAPGAAAVWRGDLDVSKLIPPSTRAGKWYAELKAAWAGSPVGREGSKYGAFPGSGTAPGGWARGAGPRRAVVPAAPLDAGRGKRGQEHRHAQRPGLTYLTFYSPLGADSSWCARCEGGAPVRAHSLRGGALLRDAALTSPPCGQDALQHNPARRVQAFVNGGWWTRFPQGAGLRYTTTSRSLALVRGGSGSTDCGVFKR